MRLLFVVNEPRFFISHRRDLAQAARAAGFEVHVATRKNSHCAAIEASAFKLHIVPISRSGANPWQELGTIMALVRLYRRMKPILVHHVALKPVIYGGIAARLTRIPCVVNALPGLGHVFSTRGLGARLRRRLVVRLARTAMKHPNCRLILQHREDVSSLVAAGAIDASHAVTIRGSGVDMESFRPSPERGGTPLVMMAGRMLWDKGVKEFVEAARILRAQGVSARFALVGEPDAGNPTAVAASRLEAWHKAGEVEWWRHREDMPSVLASSHVVCLPTTYGEGVPKILIEAAACGRPIVATDWPGCREIVNDGENGLLVPPRDPADLAHALGRLLADPELRRRMGARGRELAVAGFSLDLVVRQTLGVYAALLSASGLTIAEGNAWGSTS